MPGENEQCCQTFFSEPGPPTLKPAQFASPTNSKNLNSKTSPIFHQNSLKFRTFFGKNRKNVHPAQPAPSPSKILPAPQTLKTARGAGNSPIWQHWLLSCNLYFEWPYFYKGNIELRRAIMLPLVLRISQPETQPF